MNPPLPLLTTDWKSTIKPSPSSLNKFLAFYCRVQLPNPKVNVPVRDRVVSTRQNPRE